MRWVVFLVCLVMEVVEPAVAADLEPLAVCASKVFTEINTTRLWSGKAPDGCMAQVRVEKATDGARVTSWLTEEGEEGEEGWAMISYSVSLRYRELADAGELRKADRDQFARAKRLERCLTSLVTANDPLDCRYKASREYISGEKMGTERRWLVWLDDGGRRSVAEYLAGDTEAILVPPADIFSGTPLPPGTDLHILLD